MKKMTEFCALRAKAYAYKLDDDTEKKKAKGTKKCIIKRELMFENYKDLLFNDKIILRTQQRFRSDHHRVYTEEVKKITLVVMTIKEYRYLIRLLHIHTVQMFL